MRLLRNRAGPVGVRPGGRADCRCQACTAAWGPAPAIHRHRVVARTVLHATRVPEAEESPEDANGSENARPGAVRALTCTRTNRNAIPDRQKLLTRLAKRNQGA